MLLYGKNMVRQLEKANKNAMEAVEWCLEEAEESFGEPGADRVDGLKKKVKMAYKDLWERLETSKGFAYDIVVSIWTFEEELMQLAKKVCEATRVDSTHFRAWKVEWDKKHDRGEWVEKEIERLRNVELVPDLWGLGYLDMVKTLTVHYRNTIDDVLWTVCSLTEQRQSNKQQNEVTEGINKLSQTVHVMARTQRGDRDSGGRQHYPSRGSLGRFGRGRDGGGRGTRPLVPDDKMLPEAYVLGPMKDKGWCVHYARQSVMGGGGCMRGGKGERCYRGHHNFEAEEAKAHYNGWAAKNGEKTVK